MLGPFEALLLMAIQSLDDNAYGVSIHERLKQLTEKDYNFGAIYGTLSKLEKKGFVSSWVGDPTPERGGRAKRFYKVEGLGNRALKEQESIFNRAKELCTE